MTSLMKFETCGQWGKQRGSALVVSLILLLVISMLAIGGMQGTVMQERMSANLHDRELAFQAAEAALLGAQQILTDNPPPVNNADGMYEMGYENVPNWMAPSDELSFAGANPNVFSEQSGMGAQGRFYVEKMGETLPGSETEAGVPESPFFYSRVTAVGIGPDSAVVVLRSVFLN